MTSADKLTFVSGNPNKVIEVERILTVPLHCVSIALPEVQAATVEEVTRYKLEVAKTTARGRLIVEDVSLGFDELGNFPGVYVRWLLEAAGGRGLGTIARALLNRDAKAQCCVAYWDGLEVFVFLGECAGEILLEPRGGQNFGWDPWFKPHGSTRTFAEMDPEEKDRISHRGRAYEMLRDHLRREERAKGR